MSNHITVIGTIATAPQIFGSDPSTTLCTFRLACNERRYDRESGEWVDGATNWFTVNAFRGLGSHAMQSFSTGDRIVVTGRLRVRRWEKEERSGIAVEVEAEALGHDLRWGTSRFQKAAPARAEDTGSPSTPSSATLRSADLDAAASFSSGATGFEQPNAGSGGFGSMPDPIPQSDETSLESGVAAAAGH